MTHPLIEILHTKTNSETNVTHEIERFGRYYYVKTIMPSGSVSERPYSDYGQAKNHWDVLV